MTMTSQNEGRVENDVYGENPNEGIAERTIHAASQMVPTSPAAVGILSFAVGVGVGALLVQALTSRSAPNHTLQNLSRQAWQGVQHAMPQEWLNAMSKFAAEHRS